MAPNRVWIDLNTRWEDHTKLRGKVWPPFTANIRVGIASIISYVGAALANSAGVGGGGLFVPMFNILLGYDLKTSTALSKSMIMGGAIASVCFNILLRHPDKDSPLIDFAVGRLMQPTLLLGISIGVMCNVMFPPWLITILLCTLLTLMTVKTLQKGVATRRKELQAHGVVHQVQMDNPVEEDTLPGSFPTPIPPAADLSAEMRATAPATVSSAAGPSPQPLPPPESGGVRGDIDPARDYDYEALEGSVRAGEERPQPQPQLRQQSGLLPAGAQREGDARTPLLARAPPPGSLSMVERVGLGKPRKAPLRELADWWAVGELLLVWAIYLAIQIVKQNTPNCSLPYWLLNASQVPVTLVATGMAAWRMTVEHNRRLRGEHPQGAYGEGDCQWSFRKVCVYPLYALAAGVLGGLLGIGGGMVMGPVLLELGLPPQVTSATSTFIVVFSSSLSVVEFYLLGRIPIEVAIYFCSIAMIAAFSGLSVIRAYVLRSGRASVIVFILGSIIGASGILLGTLGSIQVVEDWERGDYMGFRSLCQNDW